MEARILGLHHITAIASDPQRNLDFYTGVLGLRLVKLTVNFDDPGSYHFYFGDGEGAPGTILTFFPWPGATRGRQGSGQATTISFAVPENSMGYWRERLHGHQITVEGPGNRFDEEFLTFHDPDGMVLELVSQRGAQSGSGWTGGPVPVEYAIGGFHSVTLELTSTEPTLELLESTFGYSRIETEGTRVRLESKKHGIGSIIDVVHSPAGNRGIPGAGTIHHIAFRTKSDEEQLDWRRGLTSLGHHVSPVMDREYFHSIYFREPGHILFEIATDAPGFATDETPDNLGTHLKLPPQYEAHRETIEQALPKLKLPIAE